MEFLKKTLDESLNKSLGEFLDNSSKETVQKLLERKLLKKFLVEISDGTHGEI